MVIVLFFFVTSFFLAQPACGEEKSVQELVSMGNDLYLKGDFKEALKVYQEALLLPSHDLTQSKIHYNLGNAYYRLGNLEKALWEYQEALRKNPEDRDTKFNLEIVLRALQGEKGILKGDPSEVEDAMQEGLDPEIKVLLQQLEKDEFQNPQGIPIPPSDEKSPKPYKRDW